MPRPPWHEVLLSVVGAFLGILAISGVNQALLPELHATLLIGSFGARSAFPACTVQARSETLACDTSAVSLVRTYKFYQTARITMRLKAPSTEQVRDDR